TSAQSSSTGSSSISPSRKSTFFNPSLAAIARLRSSISGVISTPITLPSPPTQSAASRESMPAPDPRSTPFSPGLGGPQKNGFPTPAKLSHASSGRSLSG